MNLLRKIGRLFMDSGSGGANEIWISVQCNRCKEIIRARINTRNDLSVYDGDEAALYCRKVLVGDQLCFQRIEVELFFDGNRKLVDRQIQGGQFVEPQTT